MQRVALIDADILVYEAAYRSQDSIEWEPDDVTKYADIGEATCILAEAIAAMLVHTESEVPLLVLTHSDRDLNFRRSVWPTYKDHREGPSDGRPLLYKELRQWLRENYTVYEKPGIEGDDTIGIMATMPQAWEPVIVSIDKDMDTIPGWHYNWRKRAELGVYYVNEATAFRNFIFQTLTGDSTDGYPGIPGVGPVTANFYLDYWSELPDWAVWEEVEALYEECGLTAEDALIQARCAYILQSPQWDSENQQVILWTPPEETE